MNKETQSESLDASQKWLKTPIGKWAAGLSLLDKYTHYYMEHRVRHAYLCGYEEGVRAAQGKIEDEICPACEGSGKEMSGSGGSLGPCYRCGGKKPKPRPAQVKRRGRG